MSDRRKHFRRLCVWDSCLKKIRDGKGHWIQIESYIRDHSKAKFSHGFCPECAKKAYEGVGKFEKDRHL